MRWTIAIVLAFAFALGLTWPTTAMPDAVRIPIVAPTPGRVPGAVFWHGSHAQFSCYACHPSIFPRERLGFTHVDMQAGRFCAACHDGLGAFAIANAPCERCHVGK